MDKFQKNVMLETESEMTAGIPAYKYLHIILVKETRKSNPGICSIMREHDLLNLPVDFLLSLDIAMDTAVSVAPKHIIK